MYSTHVDTHIGTRYIMHRYESRVLGIPMYIMGRQCSRVHVSLKWWYILYTIYNIICIVHDIRGVHRGGCVKKLRFFKFMQASVTSITFCFSPTYFFLTPTTFFRKINILTAICFLCFLLVYELI